MASFELKYNAYNYKKLALILPSVVTKRQITGTNKGVFYYNIPCSFDIETTSFYYDKETDTNFDYKEYQKRIAENPYYVCEKRAIMYIWQFGINGVVFIGRTWEEFIEFLEVLEKQLALDENTRLIIYVHNLSYEFQFMRKWFEWQKIFAIDTRKPIYAITGGFEFRCSYLLSNYSLAKLSDELTKYKVSKMVGDLDYSLMRNNKTELTEKEMQYCINDVLVVMAYIQEKIEDNGGLITNLPLTSTGFVRNYCRKNTLYKKGKGGRVFNGEYKKLMETLTLECDEFKSLQRAFQGGFTHANAYYVFQECENVTSYDFTSSYPYVMCSDYFPMGKAVKVNCKEASERQFVYYINNFCCLFDIMFENIRLKPNMCECPISASRCFIRDNLIINNGRVAKADKIALTITELDFLIYKDFYEWDYCTVNNMYIYKRGYLPKSFILSILNEYANKTKLKGVEGKEVEYMKSKNRLNSCYGMAVTSPIRPTYEYDNLTDMWNIEEQEIIASIIMYNNSKQRFLFYPWGVWVTAHARFNLFTGIYNCGYDYIYSDTDSIKIFNAEKHASYFEAYNRQVIEKLEKMCKFYNIPMELVAPKTIEGKVKTLGVWECEGTYKRFKTLGAKRYLIENGKGELELTVSGLNKKKTVPYLLKKYKTKDGVFMAFNDGLYIPPTETGKNIHTYIDEVKTGILVDYKGVSAEYEELSAVHLQPCEYALSMADRFMEYIRGVRYE